MNLSMGLLIMSQFLLVLHLMMHRLEELFINHFLSVQQVENLDEQFGDLEDLARVVTQKFHLLRVN